VRRHRLLVLLVAAATVAAVAAGLILHGVVAAALLLIVAGVLVALSAPIWSALPAPRRAMRFLVIALVLAAAVGKLLTGW
jgi:hypothetical protein